MNKIGRWFAGFAPVVLAIAGAPFVAAPAYAAPCPDVEVVFARGTFEP
ncbi:cutinase family protein, partial [Mycobacterium sp. ITM-2017-0098]